MFSKGLIFILISLFSITQQVNAQMPISVTKKGSHLKTPDNYYLNPEWQMGVIELNSSQKMDATLIKINIKQGFLELKKNNDILLLPIKEVKNVLLTELDMFLTLAYSTRNKTQSVSSLQKIENLLKVKNSKPTPKECYSNQYWQTANVMFDTDKELPNALIKLNLKSKLLEIKKTKKVLTIPISRINEVFLVESKETLVPLKKYDNSGTKLSGLLNVFYTKSDINLASNQTLKITAASTDTGYGAVESKKESYKITNVFVLIKNNKLFKIERKTKKNSLLFGEHWKQVANFIKTEKLSFKTKKEIIKIIDFYASLINA